MSPITAAAPLPTPDIAAISVLDADDTTTSGAQGGILSIDIILACVLQYLYDIEDIAQLSLVSRKCYQYCIESWPQLAPQNAEAVIFKSPLHHRLVSENAEEKAQGVRLVMQWIKAQFQIQPEPLELDQHYAIIAQNLCQGHSLHKITVNGNPEFRSTRDAISWYVTIFDIFRQLAERNFFKSYLQHVTLGELTQRQHNSTITDHELTAPRPNGLKASRINNFNALFMLGRMEEAIEQCKGSTRFAAQVTYDPRISTIEASLENIAKQFEGVKKSIDNLISFCKIFKEQFAQARKLEMNGKMNAEEVKQFINASNDKLNQAEHLNQADKRIVQIRLAEGATNYQLLIDQHLAEQLKTIASKAVALKNKIQQFPHSFNLKASIANANSALAGGGNYA